MRIPFACAACAAVLLCGCVPPGPPVTGADLAYSQPSVSILQADPWRATRPYGYRPAADWNNDWRWQDPRYRRPPQPQWDDRQRRGRWDDDDRDRNDDGRRGNDRDDDRRDRDRDRADQDRRDRDRDRPRETRHDDRDRRQPASLSARCQVANLPNCPNYQLHD